MTYSELLSQISESQELSERLYICTFFTCDYERMRRATVTMVKNVFGKYVVTRWSDFEYGRYLEKKEFANKDLASDCAWELLYKYPMI